MWPFLKISLIAFTAFANLFLGLLVLVRNPKNRINRVFFLIGLFFCLWTLCLLFYEFPLVFPSVFWIKACYFVVSFLVAFIWIFSFIFPSVIFHRLKYVVALLGLVFIVFTFWLLYFTRFWIIGTIIDPKKGLQTLWGQGYVWWLFIIWGIFIWALANFIYKNRRSAGSEKVQLRYLFYGFGIWSVFLNAADVLIPILFNDTRFFSISPLSSLFFTGAIAYTILKHRLMDIRLVVARTVSYSILLIFLACFYVFSLFSISSVFYQVEVNGSQIIINVILALIIAFTFQPLRQFFEKITDKIFFKDRYDTEQLLSELTRVMSSTLILKDLAERVLRKILSEVKIGRGAIILWDKGTMSNSFYKDGQKPTRLKTEAIKILLDSSLQPVIFDELAEGRRKMILRENNFAFSHVLKAKEKPIGLLLLGGKLSGDIYSDQDIELLEILTPQLTVVIENALAYQRIQKFSETLKWEVKKATTALEKTNRRLREVSALKDEFVSLTSHELRTPLTAIGGSLSTVLDGYAGKLTPQIKDFLEGAFNENTRLMRLVNNLLNISRIEAHRLKLNFSSLNLTYVINKALESLQTQAEEKKLKLIFEPLDQLTVLADEDKLKEIIINLVGNAIKFTDQGRVTVTAWRQSRLAIICTEDTGRGILLQDQKRLFRKFAQVDGVKTPSKKGGTGLGLYICKNLIEGMNGQIWLSSEHEKGSTFYFTLPLA